MGFFAPLETLDLTGRQGVRVTISAIASSIEDAGAYFEPAEWEASKQDDISLAEVRRALSSIQGSLSDAVVAARDERLYAGATVPNYFLDTSGFAKLYHQELGLTM